MQPPRAALLLLCCASAAAGLQPPARRARAPPGQRRRVGTRRGGAAPLSAAATAIAASPDKLFNAVFGGLAATAVVAKAATSAPADGKPRQADAAARELRRRFLPVFWLLRMEPFTSYAIELQSGRFDHADRHIYSIAEV